MRFLTVVLLLFSITSCTGDRFYKYCNIRVENQTGFPLSEVSIATELGGSASEVYNTSFEDLPSAGISGYQRIRSVSAVGMLMGNSPWIIISKCTISYHATSDVTRVVFEADTGTGNQGRALLQPEQDYTIVVDATTAKVSSP